MELKDHIQDLSSSLNEELLRIRRYLHQHPELSFKEFETSAYIQTQLKEWNIPFEVVAETGIVATIKGKDPEEQTYVLRGDIDALPILEKSGLPFASQNKGVMHACGHDVHTTCVLGAGYILNQMKDSFNGTIKLLFQPGEELLPGGATKIISSGVLDAPVPEAIVGQHVYPELPAGKVGFKPGVYMASTDELYVNVLGKGGHAALVHQHDNLLYMAAKVIQAIQEKVEDARPNEIPTVIRFGKIEGKGATNVIPSEVRIEGTLRTMDEKWRARAHKIIQEAAEEIFKSESASCELEIRKGYPVLKNHEPLTSNVQSWAKEYFGDSNVVDLDIRMTAEDFAYYSQKYNSCFYRLGVGSEGQPIQKLHSAEFVVNEEAIPIGAGFMAYAALKYLG